MRFNLSVKMIFVTLLLVIAVATAISLRVQSQVESITSRRESDNIQAETVSKMNAADTILAAFISKVRVLSGVGLTQMSSPQDKSEVIQLSFFQDKDIVSLSVYKALPKGSQIVERLVRTDYLSEKKLGENYIDILRQTQTFPIESVFSGNIEIRISGQASPDQSQIPFLTIGVPVVQANNEFSHIAVADFRLDALFKAFSTSQVESLFMLDKEGRPIFQSGSFELPKIAFDRAWKSLANQGQMKYEDAKSESYVAAFAKSPYGLVTIAQAPEQAIFILAKYLRSNVIFAAGFISSVALFFIFLFSLSISTPIEKLSLFAKEVAKGNFEVHAEAKSRDEIGHLAETFNQMVGGLKEREKMKSVLTKFHGSSVAEDMLKRELSLGGQKKEITVFFSDVRDFTKFSEGHTPEEVVSMLNEYFEVMVKIITDNHGVVDKFVGDAIMATWGSPQSTGKDEYYAVNACIQMRQALFKLNELRIGRGQTPIKIGIGVHSGNAISGTIGSSERMEYTVIGDTVNMTSRIESSTKAFGTDFLVSDHVAQKLEGKFIFEKAGEAEVKGKSEPLKLYKVRGYIDESGQPVVVQTPYSDYEAGHDDKVKVA